MSADRPVAGALKDAPEPPGVSIVIPAYNEESVIRQCLIAAIYQSVPAAEIIVVDNLSTDRTPRIVRQMQQEYPESPIILLQQAATQRTDSHPELWPESRDGGCSRANRRGLRPGT